MPHALIVDDHSATLSSLAEVVEAEGFTVARARTLQDARQQLQTRPPEVILLDLHLPDGEGMSLLDDLDLASAPSVVLMTGQASVVTAIEGLRRGETCLLVVRYDAEEAIVGMTAFGYDPMPDLRSGRLLVYEYATDLVDRLAHVEGVGPLVDELGWMLGGAKPARVVFDTADFVFSIQLGYGTPLQISALTS